MRKSFGYVGIGLFALWVGFASAQNYEDFPVLPLTDNIPWQFEMPPRVVAVGDIHSDPDALAIIAERTGLINPTGEWIAGNDHLVLVGDIVGKGPFSRATWDLVLHLKREAARHGGMVHVLIGNHELAVEEGIFIRYLGQDDTSAYESFAPPVDPDEFNRRKTERLRRNESLGQKYTANDDEEIRSGMKTVRMMEGMSRAWAAEESPYVQELRTRNTIIRIGRYAFVHGGFDNFIEDAPLEHVAQLNASFRRLVTELQRELLGDKTAMASLKDLKWMLRQSENGPMWTRRCAYEKFPKHHLEAALKTIGADVLFFGHTPTEKRTVDRLYQGLAYDIDTGISRAIRDGQLSAVILKSSSRDIEILDHIPRRTLHPLAQKFRDAYRTPTVSLRTSLWKVCARWLTGN